MFAPLGVCQAGEMDVMDTIGVGNRHNHTIDVHAKSPTQGHQVHSVKGRCAHCRQEQYDHVD